MAEGGNNQGTAVIAMGDDVQLKATESVFDVVGGDLIHGDVHKATENAESMEHGQISVAKSSGIATMAEGEHVEQRFVNSEVKVVSGDIVYGDLHRANLHINVGDSAYLDTATFNCSRDYRDDYSGPSSQGFGTAYFQPNDDGWWNDFPEKIEGKYVTTFIKKMNALTWRSIQENAMKDYAELSKHPMSQFYPQMKTGIDLYHGDYVPQEGFSAQSQTKAGEQITFSKLKERVRKNNGRPCAIIGQAGSGKTVLMKRLAKQLILEMKKQHESKSLLTKFRDFFRKSNEKIADVIFYMNIRDIPNYENVTLAQVLFNPAVTGLTKMEAQYGLQAVIENKIKILVFLDGLDQATWDPVSRIKVGPWTKTCTTSIFGNILSGYLLSNVPITISSREHSLACLPREMRPEFIVALTGFLESDAKMMYCEIMGDGAGEDWDEMRVSNPGMIYMCLSPLFLIFYMIAMKLYPADPPDCASHVMIRIIQILLETDHMRNVENIINKLKLMAFQGTKEHRVVFSNNDLKMFAINHRDVSDFIIKVPGLNILGHSILEGMYIFYFIHHTIQEVFSALHAVEMDFSNFKDLVSTNLHQPHWSVVRNFMCGILKNERVRSRISDEILKQSDMDAKCECLMKSLESQLKSNPPAAQQLDIFMALKEAHALDILHDYAENLDFSNSPLTPSMIAALCSIMKCLDFVPRLCLSNTGFDDMLLQALATSIEHLAIKIGSLDMRGNIGWTDAGLWKKIFKNMAVSVVFMEIPRNEQNISDANLLVEIVEAADGNVGTLNLGNIASQLHQKHLARLEKSRIKIVVDELRIMHAVESFGEDVWRQTFEPSSLCILSAKGEVDSYIWRQAAEAVREGGEVSLLFTSITVVHPLYHQTAFKSDSEFLHSVSQEGHADTQDANSEIASSVSEESDNFRRNVSSSNLNKKMGLKPASPVNSADFTTAIINTGVPAHNEPCESSTLDSEEGESKSKQGSNSDHLLSKENQNTSQHSVIILNETLCKTSDSEPSNNQTVSQPGLEEGNTTQAHIVLDTSSPDVGSNTLQDSELPPSLEQLNGESTPSEPSAEEISSDQANYANETPSQDDQSKTEEPQENTHDAEDDDEEANFKSEDANGEIASSVAEESDNFRRNVSSSNLNEEIELKPSSFVNSAELTTAITNTGVHAYNEPCESSKLDSEEEESKSKQGSDSDHLLSNENQNTSLHSVINETLCKTSDSEPSNKQTISQPGLEEGNTTQAPIVLDTSSPGLGSNTLQASELQPSLEQLNDDSTSSAASTKEISPDQDNYANETPSHDGQSKTEEPQENVHDAEDDDEEANFKSEDLIRLCGNIMMYADQPIQEEKYVYRGRMENVSGQKGRLAVKLLKKGICDFKEIDDLKTLKGHANIVEIKGSGSCNYGVHKMFIAMEYCPHNLYEYIEKYPFHLVKATTFFQQTVSAIAFIHDHEMAHRDLKPSNILVTIDNSSIKVADFGICKQIPGDRSQVTVTNPRAGTEGFKAPETYKDGIKRLGYKSDIFPLGICGYYTITHGQHPFGPDSFKWPGNIVSNENRDLSGVPAILGDHKKSQLISLLERMLKYNPGDRPTAQNVEDDIFFKGFLEVEKGSKLECSYDHTSGKPDSQTDPPPSEEEINVVQDEVRNMEPENPSSTNASNATKPKQVSSEEEPCIVDTAAFDSDDPPGTLQTHNEASNSQAALNIRVTESDSVAFSTHSEPARAGANPGKSPHPQINEKSSNLGFLEVQKSSLLKRSCDHTTCKPDSQTDPSPSKEDPTVVQDEIRDTESENSNSTNARKAMKPKQVSFADDADTAAFDSDDPPGTLQTHNEASNPQAASTESDSAAFSTHSEPARSGENPDSCAASSKKTLSCVHSDILNKDGRYIIKNQMYYDEEKLLVYCVFWIGDINHSKLPKHHSESCLTEVAVNLSDTLHFTMKTGVKDYYLVVTGSLKLSYFNDCKQKTFQRRVDPSPDNIPNKFINIDYHMWVEGKEPQNVFMRFSNLEKHERIGQLCEKCRKKTGEDSSRVVDRSVHIHHGDVSMVVGDIAESGGVINKTTHDGQSFNTASKGPK